jgi:hypothetical protein
MTTHNIVVPRVRIITVAGVKGVWVPLHPLAEYRENRK